VKYFATGLVLVGCVSAALADEPQWLVDARAKEGKLGELHTVSSADKQVSFQVPVPESATLSDEKTFYLASLQLGPNAIAACDIFKEDIDVAATLRQTAINTFADIIEPAQGKIEKKAVERIDAGVVGATPFLYVSWVYRVNDGKGAKLGALHQYAASQSGHGIYCALNDLGYSKTLEQVVRAVLGSLKAGEEKKAPYYREVSVASMRDMRPGYTSLELRRDEDGDTAIKESTVLLLAVGPDVLRAQDTYHLEWVHPDGSLINANHVVSSNGEVEANVSLKAGENGTWHVEGQFKGKDVKQDIAGGLPSTWLMQTNLLRGLLAKESPVGSEATFVQWLAIDPGNFTESTAKVVSAIDAKTYSVRESAGGTSADLVVDQHTGLVTSGTVQVGPAAIKLERVFVQGTP
jgi:hypothetical protein